jgi:acetate kinase
LSQPGQYAACEQVDLIGPTGRLAAVRVIGPVRQEDQVEISFSDERVLGVTAPVRLSGELAETPGILLEGPVGSVMLPGGVIVALRHIHMSPDDARAFGVADGWIVAVRLDSAERPLIFGDVVVRVSRQFRLELHLDTDEANAAGITPGMTATLLPNAGPPAQHVRQGSTAPVGR